MFFFINQENKQAQGGFILVLCLLTACSSESPKLSCLSITFESVDIIGWQSRVSISETKLREESVAAVRC
jgi:hypothetical protein